MKTKIIFTFLLLFVLISCDKSQVYNEFTLLPENHRWEKSEAKNYEFTISDDSKLYDLNFKFSHVYDYQFASVPINFVIENPSGEKEKFSIDLQIKDASGKELADCAGDICDLTFKVKEAVTLSKGTYKVTISTSFKGPYLPNVIGVGLSVKIAK